MKVKVQEDRKVYIIKGTDTNAVGTQNENNATELEIVVPEQYQDFNKKIVFINDDGVIWDIIENNTYKITNAITKYKSVKFYIWLTKDNQDFRSEEKTLIFNNNTNADKEITEEEIGGVNKVINLLESEITKVTSLENEVIELITDIKNKLENGEFNGKDGANGKDGQNGKDGIDGKSAYETWLEIGNEGTEQDFLNSLQGRDGKDGADGKDGVNGKDGTNGTNGVDGKDGKNYSVEVVESTTTTLEIQPNKFYKFGEVTELNLTLSEITDTTQLNEYMFEFVSGATATTLTLPDTIKWLETPSIESNKTYQCSIVNNVGVLLGVANV